MLFEDIIQCMEREEYERVSVNVPDIYLFRKEENKQNQYVFLSNTREDFSSSLASIKSIAIQLKQRLEQRDTTMKFLCIVVGDHIDQFKDLTEEHFPVWFIDEDSKNLIIYENQIGHFLGLEDIIPRLLLSKEPERDSLSIKNRRGYKYYLERLPILSLILIAVNTLIFLYMDICLNGFEFHNVTYRLGIEWEAIQAKGEYYRLFTAMFLHWDFEHLFNNMIVLFFVGQNLERITSKVRFAIIYIGGGIIAGLVSMGYNMFNNNAVLSVGASGAIFALVGAMLYVVVRNKGKIQTLSTRQIALFIFFSLYGGFTSSNIDNAAHIGGFVAGVFLGAILIKKRKCKERRTL